MGVIRVLFELEAGVGSTVISEVVEATIAEHYIAVAATAITRVCSVFNVLCSVQVKHMSYLFLSLRYNTCI